MHLIQTHVFFSDLVHRPITVCGQWFMQIVYFYTLYFFVGDVVTVACHIVTEIGVLVKISELIKMKSKK